jgi:hypothetical protein
MRLLALTLAVLAAPSIAMADPAAQKLASTRTTLLSDHFTIALPADMKVAARRASIMAAESSAEDETRAVLDDGKARFVMMAYETYSLAGPDVKAAVEADLKRSGLKGPLDPLALPRPLVGFAVTPAPVSKDRDANLAYAAWIASGDGSVQFLAFYVNPDGAAQGAGWSALGKKIIATIAPGKRVLAAKAGARTLDELAITVPDGWVASAQPGPDFTVHHLRKLVVLGQDGPSCGVYVGHHPSPQHKQQDAKAKPTVVAGKLLGAKADWSTWSDGRWSTEAMAKHPNGSDKVHVFCSAPTEAELVELRRMAETLRKK